MPETPETYFPLYPPQLSVLLEPLAHLPYGQAALVWSAVSIGLYLGACYLVWRRCSRLRKYPGLVATLALRSPAFFNLVAHGQTTSLSLLLLTAMLYPLASGRPLVAGMVFGSLIFKPHFGLAGTLVLLAVGEWRLLLGAAVAAAVQLSVGWLWYGAEAFSGFVGLASQPQLAFMMLETDLFQSHSLRTQWTLLLPSRSWALGLYVASSLFVLRRTASY